MQMYTGRYVIQIFIAENISVLAIAPLHLGQVRSCHQLFLPCNYTTEPKIQRQYTVRQETVSNNTHETLYSQTYKRDL